MFGLAPVSMDKFSQKYGYFSADLRLSKVFTFGRGLSLEVLGEAFNLFNRTNFGAPNGFITSAAFLQTSSAAPSREMQFGMKLRF